MAQYDDDEILDDEPVAKTTKLRQGGAMSSAAPIVTLAFRKARSINWRTWLVGGVSVGMLFLYSTQWQKREQSQELKNPVDARQLPGFDESKLIAANADGLDTQEAQVNAFLREERQRTVVALAQVFRGLAVTFVSTPGHACLGLTELQCLNTFDSNRIEALTALTKPAASSKGKAPANPNLAFSLILRGSNEVDRVTGLRMAKILAKPASSRTASEQSWIDLEFPIINAGLPVEELQPRPATLAQLMRQVQDARQRLLSTSKESAIRLEQCLQKSPEEQKKVGGCK